MRGGHGSSGHGTLAERTGAAVQGSAGSRPSSPARHCHVAGGPSLLVEWRQRAGGWEGRVLSVLWLEAVGWATVERWLPAHEIESP